MSDDQNILKDPVSAIVVGQWILCSLIPRAMPSPSRQSLVRALLKQLPEPSSPAVIVVRPDRTGSAPIRTNGHRTNPLKPSYDPSVVFVLELATIMATRNHESVTLMGQAVADALQTVVRDAANAHPLILARAVFYLLYLLNASQVSPQLTYAKDFTQCFEGSFICPRTRHTSYHCRLRSINPGSGLNAYPEWLDTLHTRSQPAQERGHKHTRLLVNYTKPP